MANPGWASIPHCEGARVGNRCIDVPTLKLLCPACYLLPNSSTTNLLIIGPVAAVYERSMPEYQGSSEPLVVSGASFLIVIDNGLTPPGQ